MPLTIRERTSDSHQYSGTSKINKEKPNLSVVVLFQIIVLQIIDTAGVPISILVYGTESFVCPFFKFSRICDNL